MSLDAEMRSAIKELSQVATAASVTGTRKQKLMSLAKLGETIGDGIRGERPEAKKLRTDIYQRVHDVRNVAPDGRAVRALRALVHSIEVAKNQLQRTGLGDVPETFDVSAGARTYQVGNAWGYTATEAKAVVQAIERALKRMGELSLPVDRSLAFVLDPTWSSGDLAFYDHPWSTIAVDPDGRGSVSEVYSALGDHLWYSAMGSAEREAWSSSDAFSDAFGTFLTGDKVSADAWARLTVSVGKLTSGWPERMSR